MFVPSQTINKGARADFGSELSTTKKGSNTLKIISFHQKITAMIRPVIITIEKQITVSSSVISVWDNMVPFSLYNLKAFMSREGLENIKESIIPVFADISHKIIKEARRTILNK
ncbi:MAG: hypothetical protein PUB67_06610 [Clostridiales bacterium]|nr:hypothetical protein [Clostridiales bacterium]